MKNNMLRAPLIKSAVLLAVISLIIYLTVSSPEGSVWSSIGAIFYTLFKAAQLTVGLLLALLVCFAVLTGIFFGCVAMVSTESAARMYDQFRHFIRDKADSMKSLVRMGNKYKLQGLSQDYSRRLSAVQNSQSSLEDKVRNLQSRVEQTEQGESITKLSDWLRAEEEKTITAQTSLEQFKQQLQELKDRLEEMAAKLDEVSSGPSVKEAIGRVDTLEKNSSDFTAGMQSLQEKLDTFSRELAAIKKGPTGKNSKDVGTSSSEQQSAGAHRLLSYITDSQDQERIPRLVAEAVAQEMTYAQAADHISANVAPETAKIIAEHPSLTKDYIRDCRQQK